MIKQNIKELYDSRNILFSLIRKNLYGHYRNSILGFAWHFVMPVVMMVVYYVVFTEIRTHAIPNFWVYLSSGLFPFTFMLSNLTSGSGSITANASIVKKIYFPRSILVLSQVISTFIVFLISYSIALIAIILSGYRLEMVSLLIPAGLLLMFLFVTGYCMLLSSLTVYVRDIQHLLNAFTIVFYFVTPMYFTTNDLQGVLSTAVWFNPFAYYVELFHSLIYYGQMPNTQIIAMCIILPIVSLITGSIVFNKLKNGFTERL